MIQAVLTWLFCVLLSAAVVIFVVRKAGKDVVWAGKHLFELIAVTFALSLLTAYAGTKHHVPVEPDTPTVRGINLDKPVAGPNDVKLEWSRVDGSNSVGKSYMIQRRQKNTFLWANVEEVRERNSATVEGFTLDKDYEYRIMELDNEEE